MRSILQRVLDPRLARPSRPAAAAGVFAAVLTALAVFAEPLALQAALLAVLVGVGFGCLVFLLARNQALALQEARDLWGLQHAAVDGRPWPAPGGWALGADALLALIREMQMRGSRTVLELGPGASSVVLAAADLGPLRLVGVEHDRAFVDRLRNEISIHGIDYELIHAPLVGSWYSEAALARVEGEIDVLIVDGPPNREGRGSRSKAWPALRAKLSPGAILLVDDTHRSDERQMVSAWLSGGGLKSVYDGGTFMLLETIDGPRRS